MFSLNHTGAFNEKDIVIQPAACTFDIHVLGIVGSLIFGASVVLLHPYGNMNIMYFCHTLQNKQVTYVVTVPSFLNEICAFIENNDGYSLLNMRSICSGGK